MNLVQPTENLVQGRRALLGLYEGCYHLIVFTADLIARVCFLNSFIKVFLQMNIKNEHFSGAN